MNGWIVTLADILGRTIHFVIYLDNKGRSLKATSSGMRKK